MSMAYPKIFYFFLRANSNSVPPKGPPGGAFDDKTLVEALDPNLKLKNLNQSLMISTAITAMRFTLPAAGQFQHMRTLELAFIGMRLSRSWLYGWPAARIHL
jgi:hypothetical protein